MGITKYRNKFIFQDRHFRTKIKNALLALGAVIFSAFAVSAQSPIGMWVTIDDKREVDIAHVRIYQEDGKLYGKVVKLLPAARNRTCKGCSGDEKGRSIVGMTLIRDIEPNGDRYWSNGKLFDPNSGRNFDCTLWLDDPDVLKVRASFGLSLLGRTQTWKRLD